jgi:hypothetical protein
MNITETKQLLDSISAIDNRTVTVDTLNAWHGVIGNIPLEIAREALKLAQQDASIKYLEPRHIFGWAKEAAFRLDRTKPKKPEILNGTPMPECKDHAQGILTCDPCCHRLYKFSEQYGFTRIHEFAKAEIYA